MQICNRGVVIGAGTMGANLARLMLRNGMAVTVLDIDSEVLARCRQALQSESGSDGKVRFVSDWAQVGECYVVVESVTENLVLKHRVLKEAECHVSDATLILTNTSGYPSMNCRKR